MHHLSIGTTFSHGEIGTECVDSVVVARRRRGGGGDRGGGGREEEAKMQTNLQETAGKILFCLHRASF